MTATSQQLTMRSLFVVFFLVAMILGTVLGDEEDKEGFRHHTGQPNFSGRPPFGQWSHGTGVPRHLRFTTTPPAGRK